MMTIKNKRCTVLPKRPFNRVLSSFVVAGFSSAALANPQNPTVVEGNAPVVTANGSELSIATDGRTILNWASFSIGNGELTRFVMSGNDRAVLNRVTGGALSQIDGTLEANGRLYLINPNGVIVGATGVVQTQSFIASTRDLVDEDFMDGGELTFVGTGSSEVHNLGTIEASDGEIALIGHRVVSSGAITASRGVIALAAGDEVMLAAPDSDRLLVRVNRIADHQAAVDHTGILHAAQVELQAAGGNPYALAVNAGGQINATGIQNREGRIYLSTDVAQINVPGTLTARNSDGTGGRIDIDSGSGYGSEIDVDGTLDVTSTTWGGVIDLDGSRILLNDSSRLVTSADLTAGGVFVGTTQGTDYVRVAPDAIIEANSSSGDAGIVDLNGSGVYFYGQVFGRGVSRPGELTVNTGEALEYAGFADLRAWNDETRFGSVNISSNFDSLTIDFSGSSVASLIDAEALATQLNYSNVLILTRGGGRTVDLQTSLSWQSATQLMLQATSALNVDQAITANNGSLQLRSLDRTVTADDTITVRELWLSAHEQVNLSGPVVAQNVTLYDIGGGTSLTHEQNQLGGITFTQEFLAQSGAVDIVDSAGGLSLTTDTVDSIAYSTNGNFRVRTSGDLTLSSAFQTQVDGDVTLVAAGGVLRNQSSAGANVFGTSSTGLDRTRIYAAGLGENGGLTGPAQYNVSYSANHEATANTGFYYSGNAPQEPNPPEPVDPVDPTPETPVLPPSLIIQTALDGNSFEQLNRPSQTEPSQLTPVNVPIPPLPVDQSGWTTSTTDRLETLAGLAELTGSEQSQQPPPQVVDQIEDMTAQVLSYLQQQLSGAGGSGADPQQFVQGLGSMPPELQQLLTQSPAVFQQQLAIVLTQLTMEPRNAVLEDRAQAMTQEIDRIKQAAEQMRNAALEQMMTAIAGTISQIVEASVSGTKDTKLKTPNLPVARTPPPPATPPIKNVPPSNGPPPGLPGGGAFQAPVLSIPNVRPPSPPEMPPPLRPTSPTPVKQQQPAPIIVPVPVTPPMPPAVQIRIPK